MCKALTLAGCAHRDLSRWRPWPRWPFWAAHPARPASKPGSSSIGDGDTIRVQQGSRRLTIRFACIDAPEMAQRPHGPRAREYLRLRLPIGRVVTLKVQTTDRYGRTVAEVFSDINVNLALVEDGQAFAYRKYLDQCDAKEYLAAEYRASRSRYGIWQVPGGITRPWDFRRGRRSSGRLTGALQCHRRGGTDAKPSDPMRVRWNYCGRATPTWTVMVMGRRVKG